MSRDLNHCTFIGRLGNEPEQRFLPNGDEVCNITIAVGDDYKDKNGQKQEVTEWVRITAFRNLAGIISKYCKKGSKVYISGKMKTRSWEADGVKKYSTEIVADNMIMLDSKGGESHPQESAARTPPQPRENRSASAPAPSNFDQFGDMDSEIPF